MIKITKNNNQLPIQSTNSQLQTTNLNIVVDQKSNKSH